MGKGEGVVYGTVLEADGSVVEIRRLRGTYYICLVNGEDLKQLPIRSEAAMDILKAAKRMEAATRDSLRRGRCD